MTARPAPRRRLAGAIGTGLAVALLAACGGDDEVAAPTTTATEATTTTLAPVTTAPAPEVAPLTGLPASAEVRARAAVSVKIDNAPLARPQAGMQDADVVYEEVVEGGVVRFMAVFQSRENELVGPVRSVRPVDANLVGPLQGGFAFSGGSPTHVESIQKAPVKLIGIDQVPSAYRRRSDRKSPHNLYTGTGPLRSAATKAGAAGPPPAIFAYRQAGTASTAAGAATASGLNVVLGALTTAAWSFDPAAGWVRTTNGSPHTLEGGSRLSFPNVVVLSVEYRGTSVVDQSGATSPEAIVIGGGDALVLTTGPGGGQLVKGRWSKGGQAEVMKLTDQAGAPIGLAPGPTWVTLAPLGAPTSVA